MNMLKKLRTQKGIYQKDIAAFLGIDRTTYVKWENGKAEPNQEVLKKLAEYFDVSIDYLIGYSTINNIKKKKGVRIPVFSRMQAGIPVDAIDYEEITEEMAEKGDYFGLVIHGQSMTPRMVEGDVIIVRKQPDVESGDIAVVLVNGNDATVKKIRKTENGIELVPLNPSFDIIYYTNEEIGKLPVAIIGKVVELRGKF